MPNEITADGMTIATRDEIVSTLSDGLRLIYGSDINLEANSPDGNLVQLLAQAARDYEELVQAVYNSFDPDQATGVNLDLRCAINGLVRKAGTRTTQLVTVTVTQAVTLVGFDDDPNGAFTISNSSGDQFQLIASHSFGAAGSADLDFQSAQIGAVEVADNSLTNVVTVQLGVASVTNGTLDGTIGTDEESDYQLRIRRQNSVAIPSKGYLEGLLGALLAIEGVTSAVVYENDTGGTVDGIPAHSIWVIVDSAAVAVEDDVANAIYVHRNAGCGMKGSTTVDVTQVDGTTFTVAFDLATDEDLYISFNLTAITGSADDAYVRAQLAEQLTYTIGQPADASAIVALVKEIAPNCYVDSEGVSNMDGSYIALQATTDVNYQWAVAGARIKINGSF